MVWKNNLSGIGYPAKSKYPEDEGLSKPVTIPKKRAKSKTGLKCCKDNKNKINKSSSMNKFKKEEIKTNFRSKNPKTTFNSKTSQKSQNINIYSSNLDNNNTIKSNGMPLNNTNQSNQNKFISLPPEMKVTFEKMISQLDLVAKTVKIMDKRIQSLEGQISTLFNRRKKGFVQKQPPQMGDYQYLLENSNNFIPNNSINNNEVSQKLNEQINYTADLYNSGNNYKEIMDINDENKKNVFKTEVDLNQINKKSLENVNNDENMYKGLIQEEYEYNGEEQVIEGEEQEIENNEDEDEQNYNNPNHNENEYEQEYMEEQGEEYEEMQGEEYEEGQGEEYVEGQEEEYIQEDGNEEEQINYDNNNEENNDE